MEPVIRLKLNKLDKGLTLLEIIISMGIALVAILTMLIFFAYALDSIREAKTIAQATAIAQKTMEEYLSKSEEELRGYADEGEVIEPFTTQEVMYDPATNSPIDYTVTVKVERMTNRLLNVLVEVKWKYKSDRERPIILESYVPTRI